MKNIKHLYTLFLVIASLLIFQACSEDDPSSISFSQVALTYSEADGTGTIVIPVQGSSSDVTFQVDGTATEGEDFEIIGLTASGLEIEVIADGVFEGNEYARIRMVGPDVVGNAFFTLNIISDCSDTGGLDVSYFAGDWDALEDYGAGGTYGPYHITLVQDATNLNRFDFDNLYDSGCDAYMIFDFGAGTVYFPNQSPCGDPLTNSSGTFDIDECTATTLTINLNFDGGDWIYRFTKL